MIRNRILLKAFAIFFILEMLASTVLPNVALALTAGPTAPEATSFEPVDTTDMVNLSTGDLVYNIPLLEIPGPAGGYPLSLSYHAGIQPNEEASWVGLGWTLNPGSLTRNVNGFADDHFNMDNMSRFFWAGGSTETFSIGVSVGVAGTPVSVSAGLSVSHDTYQGSGVGMHMGFGGTAFGQNSPTRLGVTVGVSPFGSPYASAGLSLSAPLSKSEKTATSLSASVGVSTNFKTVSASGSAGVGVSVGRSGEMRTFSATDASISSGTQGMSASGGVAGLSYDNNISTSERLRTSSSGFSLPIPIFPAVSITLGYNYQRYWIDEMDDFKVHGALYFPNKGTVDLTKEYFDDNSFDTYSLLDPNLDGGIVDNPDPDMVLGGTFPEVDNYSVQAQGIFGTIKPYYFQKYLYKRNKYDIDDDGDRQYRTFQYDLSYGSPADTRRAEFRFLNDFANRFEYTPSVIDHEILVLQDPDLVPLNYNFASGSDLRIGEEGHSNYTSNYIQGSRHIEWFTNEEIVATDPRVVASGFKETVSTGFTRVTADSSDDKNIGAFVITNESGVKYHFSLPAYSYAEYMYSENKEGTETFNEFDRPGKYAYTWYLTGITGPDYVDRGPNGVADGILNKYDWGYWVEFEYGKWTEEYAWRNPSQGMTADLDNKFQNFSEGKKEVYYLDAIRTKSHTALFIKDIRHDAKSALYFERDMAGSQWKGAPASGRKTIVAPTKDGGFVPRQARCNCNRIYVDINNPANFLDDELYYDEGYMDYVPLPTSSMKLHSIILISNDKLGEGNLSKQFGLPYRQISTASWTVQRNSIPSDGAQCDFSSLTRNHHLFQNVYDIHDLNNSSAIVENALRQINFVTDYSLVPRTANSFDFTRLTQPDPENGVYETDGKLTLVSVEFRGKAGEGVEPISLVPPLKFRYDLKAETKTGVLEFNGGEFILRAPSADLREGDLIVFGNNSNSFGLVTNINQNEHSIKIVGDNEPAPGLVSFRKTKNPPYHADKYDMWGYYKSDFDDADPKRIARLTTEISSKSVDVWSLRSVRTPTGANLVINYESDSYSRPVLDISTSLVVKSVTKVEGTTSQIRVLSSASDLSKYVKEGTDISYSFLFADVWTSQSTGCNAYDGGFDINLGSGTLRVGTIWRDDESWVINTDTDLTSFYRVKDVVTHGDNCGGAMIVEYGSPVFVVGHVFLSQELRNYGGGVRVTDVSVVSSNLTTTTHYEYGEYRENGAYRSFGVTSYEPGGLDEVVFYYPTGPQANFFYLQSRKDVLEKTYKKEFYKNFARVLMNSRVVPAPGVVYEYVKVSESFTESGQTTETGNFSVYEFKVFDEGMIGLIYDADRETIHSTKNYGGFVNYDKKRSRNVYLKDYTSRIGVLKRITLYHGDQKISETINHYLDDDVDATNIPNDDPDIENELEANIKLYEPALSEKFNNQGVMEETFASGSFIKPKVGNFILQGVVSKRETYPSIQTGQTNINYKSGITTRWTNLAFDFYSGQPIKTLESDGNGNYFITDITPAYRIYPLMGQSVNGGKNMLTQQAATYVYKTSSSNIGLADALVGASIQTWSDGLSSVTDDHSIVSQTGIWRKLASYTFTGEQGATTRSDGLLELPNNEFPSFDAWHSDDIPIGWNRNSVIRLYNVFSNAVEAEDINGNFACTKMSSDQTMVLASLVNSSYEESVFSGAEDKPVLGIYGGGVEKLDGEVIQRTDGNDVASTHTGLLSLKLDVPGEKTFRYAFSASKDRAYYATVWVNAAGGRLYYKYGNNTPVASAPPAESRRAGSWYQISLLIPASDTPQQLQVWCETAGGVCLFDDFRVHPYEASMTSYVYNEWGELECILDNNNLFTRFEYDGMGRLKATYRESFSHEVVKLGESTYHYKAQND